MGALFGLQADTREQVLLFWFADLDDLGGFFSLGGNKVEDELLRGLACAFLDAGERLDANACRVGLVTCGVLTCECPVIDGSVMLCVIKPVFRARNLASGRFENLR